MDAFAVSVCKGLALGKIKPHHMIIVGAWFGIFQGVMPLIGYLIGSAFNEYITAIDHWIAFLLLGFIGVKMIVEAVNNGDEDADGSLRIKTMFLLAVATSIDALSVGVTFSLIDGVNIYISIAAIAVITFLLAASGIKIGSVFGVKYRGKAELIGGLILVIIGLKILLEDLEIISL